VYVCTTAEREYAWEAWRLLDPDGSLFPLAELPWRLLCVSSPQKKDLLNVLRKRDIDAVTAAGHVAQRPSDLQYIDDEGEEGCARVQADAVGGLRAGAASSPGGGQAVCQQGLASD
jgi:hypothetical protein